MGKSSYTTRTIAVFNCSGCDGKNIAVSAVHKRRIVTVVLLGQFKVKQPNGPLNKAVSTAIINPTLAAGEIGRASCRERVCLAV